MKKTPRKNPKSRKIKPRKKFYIILISITVAVFILSLVMRKFPAAMEFVYSRYIYKFISQTISTIFGIFPISIGELLVYALVAFLIGFIIYSIIKSFYNLYKKKKKPFMPLMNLLVFMVTSSMILYSLFYIMWGFNHSRKSFAEVVGWEVKESPVSELYDLTAELAQKCNSLRKSTNVDEKGVVALNGSVDDAFKRSRVGYDRLAFDYPLLDGTYSRPKPVLTSKLMSYAGITGIFLPYTYEANVNTMTPESSLPQTIMHEMAHQRGFAREDEANFIGYLACKYHPDIDFQYSGYYHALTYSLNELYRHDAEQGDKIMGMLSDDVVNDMRYEDKFWKQFESPIEDISTAINDTYLKANNQLDGVYSYGRVVDLLLAERRVEQ